MLELFKWLISAVLALTITLAGIGLAIGAVIFATFIKVLGIFTFIAGGLAMMIKERIDERSKPD